MLKKNRLDWLLRFIILTVFLLILLCYFFIPEFKFFINKIFIAFSSVDKHSIESFIKSYGNQAAIVSFFLMVFQAVIAPLPAFLITFANASLFGAFWGGLLSWISSIVGAALCFFISRVFGREAVEKLVGVRILKAMDGFFDRYGKHTILVCRLLPFVPFDAISYAAGLTSMRLRTFLTQTAIGELPATIVYSCVGGLYIGGSLNLILDFSIMFGLGIIIYIAKNIYNETQNNKSP